VRLRILGCSGTYPTEDRPASGYLLHEGDRTVLLDIGHGVFPKLLATGALPDAIVISHRHPDHCSDLPALLNYLRFDRPDAHSIPVFAPRGVADSLARFIHHGPGDAFFSVFRHSVIAPGDRLSIGGFTLTFGRAAHPVPSICVRVEGRDHALTYSGDTGPGGDLEELASGTGTLLCEATLQGAVTPDRFTGHLYAAEAARLAASTRATRLVLTHLAPRLDASLSKAEAREVFAGEILIADPGMEVAL
jgi:ribonuclease BN (tRNA processing enzyme)